MYRDLLESRSAAYLRYTVHTDATDRRVPALHRAQGRGGVGHRGTGAQGVGAQGICFRHARCGKYMKST